MSPKLITGSHHVLDCSEAPPREERYAGLLRFSWFARLSTADLFAGLLGFLESALSFPFLLIVDPPSELIWNGNGEEPYGTKSGSAKLNIDKTEDLSQ